MSIPQDHTAVTADWIRRAVAHIESLTTVVICHPDDEERVQGAVNRTEFPGLIRVVSSPMIDKGTMLVSDSAALWLGAE